GREGQRLHREPRGATPAVEGLNRLRPHALGDPRGAVEGERPSARRLHRQDRLGPQRDHRELREFAGEAAGPGSHVREPDGHGEPGPPHRIVLRRRPREGDPKALGDIRGSYAVLAVHADEPGKVIGARNESPLVVGLGPDENFLASDVPALLRYTDRVAYVMDREMVVITPQGVAIKDFEGHAV